MYEISQKREYNLNKYINREKKMIGEQQNDKNEISNGRKEHISQLEQMSILANNLQRIDLQSNNHMQYTYDHSTSIFANLKSALLKVKSQGLFVQFDIYLCPLLRSLFHQKWKIQDMVLFFSELLLQNKYQIKADQKNKDYHKNTKIFSKLSLALYKKLNIDPSLKQTHQQQNLSTNELINGFVRAKKDPFNLLLIKLLFYLYKNDNLLKSNPHVFESLQVSEQSLQKIFPTILKKAIFLFENKINENILKSYLCQYKIVHIYALIISNYKIKSFCEALLKYSCEKDYENIFINIPNQIVKPYVEYLLLKDEYKYRYDVYQKMKKKSYQISKTKYSWDKVYYASLCHTTIVDAILQ